jgi:uncharacterized protein YjcR
MLLYKKMNYDIIIKMDLYSLPDDILLHIVEFVDAKDLQSLNEIDQFATLFNTYFISQNKRVKLLNNSTIDLTDKYELIKNKWIPISLYRPSINIVRMFKSYIHTLYCDDQTYADKDLIKDIPNVSYSMFERTRNIQLSNCIFLN